MGNLEDNKEIVCSFCGKGPSKSFRLIAGPHDIFICDECVSVCVKILDDENAGKYIPSKTIHQYLAEFLNTKRFIPSSYEKRGSLQTLYIAPNSKQFTTIFKNTLLPLAEKYEILLKKSPAIISKQPHMQKIIDAIFEATLVIIDITGSNKHIMYLLGMVFITGRPLLVLTQDNEDIPPYLMGDRIIQYEMTEKGIQKLESQTATVFEFMKNKKILIDPPSAKTTANKRKRKS
jgi:hypothetical protein